MDTGKSMVTNKYPVTLRKTRRLLGDKVTTGGYSSISTQKNDRKTLRRQVQI